MKPVIIICCTFPFRFWTRGFGWLVLATKHTMCATAYNGGLGPWITRGWFSPCFTATATTFTSSAIGDAGRTGHEPGRVRPCINTTATPFTICAIGTALRTGSWGVGGHDPGIATGTIDRTGSLFGSIRPGPGLLAGYGFATYGSIIGARPRWVAWNDHGYSSQWVAIYDGLARVGRWACCSAIDATTPCFASDSQQQPQQPPRSSDAGNFT